MVLGLDIRVSRLFLFRSIRNSSFESRTLKKIGQDITVFGRIEHYINGLMTFKEVAGLWIALMKEPDYIDYLEMYLLVRELLQEEWENSMGLSPRACL
ncbi:MAG: hypothetical protein ACNS60_13815 [Candidatus Cyclobacteriaceae bacterium M2_1C_046]